ncbi:MAG: DUF4197 domain-containing protein [Gammaproteobacteria bacterium]|nr:DUF4197 domain-containing protein [Gammaproteobacteria bacterium]
MHNIICFFALIFIYAPANAFDLGDLKRLTTPQPSQPAGNAGIAALSDGDVVNGLKEALTQGADNAVANLGRQDGFLGNDKVRILPDAVRKAEPMLRTLGQGKAVDDLVTSMNRAAEAAVPEAKTLLVAAIKQMSVQDAKQILTGPEDAATQYFRKSTEPDLRTRFLPIVDKAVGRLGVTGKYNRVAGSASKLGLVGKDQATVQDYVTQKALDGLFLMVADEERAIRTDPVARTGYW